MSWNGPDENDRHDSDIADHEARLREVENAVENLKDDANKAIDRLDKIDAALREIRDRIALSNLI